MDFWFAFYSVPIVLALFLPLLNERTGGYIEKGFAIYIWFVSAFRYMIGDDYASYISYYRNTDIDDGLIGFKEPIFNLIIWIGNSLGFDYQFLFIFYSSVTILFIYLGLKYYCKNSRSRLLFLMLYTSFFAGGYYWGLNVIRQAAAITILFWGTKYLLKDDKVKFLFVYLIAICMHYSAIIYIITFFIAKKRYTFSNVFMIILVAILMSIAHLPEKIVSFFMSYSAFLSGKYGTIFLIADESSSGGVASTYAMIALFSMGWFFCCKKNYLFDYCINLCTVYLILRILSCGDMMPLLSSLLTRISVYYSLFYLLFIVYCLEVKKYTVITHFFTIGIVFAFVFVMIYIISVSNNIDYQWNFNIFT